VIDVGQIAITLASTSVDSDEMGEILPAINSIVEFKWGHRVEVTCCDINDDQAEDIGARYRPYGSEEQGGTVTHVTPNPYFGHKPDGDILTLRLDDGHDALFYRKDLRGKKEGG